MRRGRRGLATPSFAISSVAERAALSGGKSSPCLRSRKGAGSGDRSGGRSRGVDVRTPVADDVVELDRPLERRTAQGLLARIAPPFTRQTFAASRREMTRDRLRFRLSSDERCGRTFVAAASREAVVPCVLNERMFEPVGCLRRGAIDKEKARVQDTRQRGCEPGFVESSVGGLRAKRDVAQKGIGAAPSQDCTDRGGLARRA
jgi:hypothetical protein